jgi:hypothetical protein
MTRRLLALAFTLAPLALVACGSPCEDLATRICTCQPAGTLRDTCVQSVKNQIGDSSTKPSDAQQQFCETRLKTCADPNSDSTMCDRLKTAQGKEQCGLAF